MDLQGFVATLLSGGNIISGFLFGIASLNSMVVSVACGYADSMMNN